MVADAEAQPITEGRSAGSGPCSDAFTGRLRWAVNSSEWQPQGEHEGPEFRFLLGLIREQEDRDQVMKYVRFVDKKRALISRLLVRQASAVVLGLSSFQDLEIGRTKGKKPFLRRPRPERPEVANFNFSISHEGDWVILASEPLLLCGADVAAPREVRPGASSSEEVFRDLEEQLTASEWDFVRSEERRALAGEGSPEERPEDAAYGAFQRHWCCKEAFVKARGDGLEFPFNRVAFALRPVAEHDADAVAGRPLHGFGAWVDGVDVSERWRLFGQRLPGQHWAAVARGPTCAVIDANGEFRRTLVRPSEGLGAEARRRELGAEEPHFSMLSVGSLVPGDEVEAFRRSGGRLLEPVTSGSN